MEIVKKLHAEEHVINGLSYKKIQEKYNINRGQWNYYATKYGLKCDPRKNRMLDDYLTNIDSENKAYILGFIYADGCITSDGRIAILLNEKDLEILEFIKSEMKIKLDIKRKNDNSKDRDPQVLLRFTSHKMYNDLVNYGFTTNKTHDDSNMLCNVPYEFKKDFIRGYCDGDGNVRCSKNKKGWYKFGIAFSNGTSSILNEITLYFKEHNVDFKLKKYTNKSDYYLLACYKKEFCLNFCNHIYNNDFFSLNRKKEKALEVIRLCTNTEVTKDIKKSLVP